MSFQNTYFLVTGAAQGIGKAIAMALAKQRAIVFLTDINEALLFDTLLEIQQHSPRSQGYLLDIRDKNEIETVFQLLADQGISLDGLVNVAGILHLESATDISLDAWQHTFDVNTTGVFNVCKTFSPMFIEQKKGTIVTVGSNAAHVPRQNMAAYCASKAATHQYMKCLGLELAQYNVRCNIVAPGSTITAMQTQLWAQSEGSVDDKKNAVITGSTQTYRNGIPLNKIAQPKEVADVVLFLLSEASSHMTMETLTVDGGATLGV